ncbi:MAG: penicillin-binding protein 1A [Holosporales bacterium]
MRLLFVRLIQFFAALMVTGTILGVGAAYVGYRHFSEDLPDYSELKSYEPPVVSRLHSGDGRLLAEYAEEKRVFIPIGAMPDLVKQAFLSAEDKNFYNHSGVDLPSIARAALTNAFLKITGQPHRPQGASTITQQVTKNFLVGNERTLRRKIREAILSTRIEKALSKDRILELYLNEIYLGMGSYGVAAAALNYFNKSLDELSPAEAAYLAGLPKAPNNYHPVQEKAAAIGRRNWVLSRMYEDGVITREVLRASINEPLAILPRAETQVFKAEDFSEEVRRWLVARYGQNGVYRGGLSVKTTLDPTLQSAAEAALRNAIIAYDRRHGWRGPIARLDFNLNQWEASLRTIPNPYARLGWQLGTVSRMTKESATVILQGKDKNEANLDLASVRWARRSLPNNSLGNPVNAIGDVLNIGDVIYVRPRTAAEKIPAGWELVQPPEVNGGFVALDPHTGRVLALVGGFNYQGNQFNRVTQAKRQPGSTFKPFVYLAALEHGYNPSTIVLDAPIAIDMGPSQGIWRPENYTKEYYGLVPMRTGIEKSRNLMTIRIAQAIGMRSVSSVAQRFGIYDKMPLYLSGALGVHETTLLRMTNAYAMFVNGGQKVDPTLIDRIQDRTGKTVYKHDDRACDTCETLSWEGQSVPTPSGIIEMATDSASAYQSVSMLEGAVQRGTATALKVLGRPLAGKTGTTNDYKDVWFIGFSPDIVAGVYIGYDEPRNLGEKETGAAVAVPAFRDFMSTALANKPIKPFRISNDVTLVRINTDTGTVARPGDSRVAVEVFKRDTPVTHTELGLPNQPTPGATEKTSTPQENFIEGIY